MGEPRENHSPSEPKTNEEKSEKEVVASSISTSTEIGSNLQFDIYALERLKNDNLLRLQIGVTNNSPEAFDIGFSLSETENHRSAEKISLIDDTNQKHHLSFNQSDNRCFCNQLDGSIQSGETEILWVIYPAPGANVEKMTILNPIAPPLLDVPISDSTESVENNNLAEPEIFDLTLISDSMEGDQTGRTESNEEVSIILSSDVLFESNSSDLSDEAIQILEQVAQEINDASSAKISVDGHADNTGSDAVNIPLSEDRAKSVELALKDLIEREGITFEVEGYGSADPIANNETEEGRERNRRVSVTFEK